MGVLILCIFGVLAALRVPVQMIPDLEVRTITVRTTWPGATPQDVEKEILIDQEEYLRNIPNLRRMISQATTAEATIELEFPFGTDVNEALIRVNNALSQVPSYPENVDEPRLYTSSFSENSFMFFRVEPHEGNPRRLDMDFLRDFVDDRVRTRMERVPGVSEVSVRGGAEREVQIFVDPARLAERAVTLAELRDAIRARNRDASGGDLDAGKRRYLLRTLGRFENLGAIRDLVVARRGDAIIHLRDVATVRLHHAEIRARAFANGERVIYLSVRRESGSNVVATKRALMPVVEEINREILAPAGMRMRLTSDDVRYVEASIVNVWTNLALGAALASAVMFLFLRSAAATLIAIVGVPICAIGAFLGLSLAGRTINVISLAGVAFAIGMTLDNTIVVLESIEHERRRGLGRREAALAGTRRVWPAVLASTLTTILVFAPVLFVREEAGQLYSDVAIAISASILLSMAVAVTVVPAAAARLSLGAATAGQRSAGALLARLLAGVAWLIATGRRRTACVGAVLAATAAVILFLTPPAEYLPEGEEPKIFSSMIAPPGYSLTEMSKLADEVHAELLPHVGADRGPFRHGETDVPPIAYFNLIVQPQSLRLIGETVDRGDIEAFMTAVDRRFAAKPGMRSFSNRGSIISSNDGGTRSVNLDVRGAELAPIYDTALAAYRRAREVFAGPQIGSEPPSLVLGQPLVELRPRWERAAELGFTAGELGWAISALADGAYVDEFFLDDDDKVDIFLYGAPGGPPLPSEVGDLLLYAPQGTVVPVSAVADVVETVDTDVIRRVDGRRTITLNVIAPRAVPLETAVETVRTDVLGHLRETGGIAPGVTVELSGASDQLDATREALGGNFAVAVVLCYLLLVVIFTHWGYPFVIMTTVPLGIAGGIVGLWLMNAVGAILPVVGLTRLHQPFDMITMLGFLILLGTVVNNPILIVDQTLHNVRELGMAAREAVEDAVAVRLRPILMTTITTACGLAPLVFIPGAGTELYRGVGAIVLFGLVCTAAVTLTFLPALLVTVLGWRAPARAAPRRLSA